MCNWAMFRKPQPLQLVWESTAVHLQFVRQYAPHLYRRAFLVSKLRRKENPAIRLPFVLQYASHLYGSTPPICTAGTFLSNLGVWVDKSREPLETPLRWSLPGLKCGDRMGCKPSCSADDGGTPARAIQASNQWMASPPDQAWESPPPLPEHLYKLLATNDLGGRCKPAVFCENLRFSAKICGFFSVVCCALQMLEYAKICSFLQKKIALWARCSVALNVA